MNMNDGSRAAQFLGRLGKGKPKKFSAAELKKRTERLLAGAKANRWPKKTTKRKGKQHGLKGL